MTGSYWPSRPQWLAIGLLALTVFAYTPAWSEGGFVWDDDDYVQENENLRSVGGLWRTWTEPRSLPQYYPLVHTTFWVEYQLWGQSPRGYHATNVGLHALGSFLLWLVLKRLEVPGAWLAAAIFAVHPVHVESVAWITERKNVLSGVFYFAALLAWLRHAPLKSSESNSTELNSPVRPRHRRGAYYALTMGFFIAALLSKSVTATLPAAMLVVAWWKSGTVRRADLELTLPMFVLGVAAGAYTAWLEQNHVHAVGPDWAFTVVERLLIAGQAVWFYFGKLLWPHPLAFFYERWEIDTASLRQYLLLLSAVGVPVVLWMLRRKLGRGPLAAVLLFGGTLFPALGFLNVYPMRYSFVADHFQYLASVPLIVLSCAAVGRRWGAAPNRRAIAAASFLVLAVLSCLTWRQALNYRGPRELWLATIASNPQAWAAHLHLGKIHYADQDFAQAAASFKRGLDLRPHDPQAQFNYGWLMHELGRSDEGLPYLEQALINPELGVPVRVQFMLGRVWAAKGDAERAAYYFEQAVEYADRAARLPKPLAALLAAAQSDLAWIRATHPSVHVRNGRQAVRLATEACEYSGWQDLAHLDTLGAAHAELGDFDKAIDTVQQALKIANERGDDEWAKILDSRRRLYMQRRPIRMR